MNNGQQSTIFQLRIREVKLGESDELSLIRRLRMDLQSSVLQKAGQIFMQQNAGSAPSACRPCTML